VPIAMAHHDNAIYLVKKNCIYVLKWLLLVVSEERIIFMAFSWRGGAQYCNAVAVAVAVPAVARLPQARSGTITHDTHRNAICCFPLHSVLLKYVACSARL